MRVFMTSFAALLALVTFGPGVMDTALGGDTGTNAKTNGGPAGVAGSPAIPPVPMADSAPTLAPAPPPAPAPTLTPAPAKLPAATFAPTPAPVPAPTFASESVPSRTPAGQARDEVGNPGMIQTPRAGANAGVVANQSGDQWRYRWHNNNWWYWTTENRWVFRNGSEWTNYEPAVTAVPDARYSSQPLYGYYQSQSKRLLPRSVSLFDRIPRLLQWARSTRVAIMARVGTTASQGSPFGTRRSFGLRIGF